jgi:hypothetical protein
VLDWLLSVSVPQRGSFCEDHEQVRQGQDQSADRLRRVSAVPMAAVFRTELGLEADSSNFLIMHAMGPNVAGVIGTAVAAGVMIAIFGG